MPSLPPIPAVTGLPPQVDLSAARTVGGEIAPVDDPPFLTRAGVLLAAGVLLLMAFIAFVLIGILQWNEVHAAPTEVAAIDSLVRDAMAHYHAASSPETLKEANDLLTRLASARKESREVWVGLVHVLLLNLLLPVLTSLLGYVYGTSKGQD